MQDMAALQSSSLLQVCLKRSLGQAYWSRDVGQLTVQKLFFHLTNVSQLAQASLY